MKNQPFNVLRHNNWDAAPREPVSIGTAIGTALGIGGTALGTTVAFGVTVAGAIGYVATSLVTSWALRALAPKPPELSSFGGDTSSRGTLVNQKDPLSAHDFVYGQTRKGGAITYYETTGADNKFLHQIIVLAGHELEEIGDIYLNDEVVTLDGNGFVTTAPFSSKIRINKHLGAANQTVDADLLAESNQITSAFRGQGIAYLYIRYEYDQDAFPNGLPLVTAVVKGKKVYDPRTATTAYSNNAALCVRDFITSAYGLSDDQVDDTVFSAAANICDENVSLSGGGTEKKYTINGITRADINYGDVLGDMMTACAGSLFWGAGKWKLTVGDYTAPTKTLTLDDLRGPINLATRVNLRDQFNAVQGTFNDASQRWIVTDYPQIKGAAFVTEDGGQETALDLRLPYTTSSATAQRLAKLTLYRGREQMTFTADFGLNAFDVEVGEIIALTNERYGWTEKEFEVVGWSFGASEAGALTVSLTLRETSESAFDWNAEEIALIQNNTNLPSGFDAPAVSIPQNTVVSRTRVIRENVSEIITFSVTSARPAEIALVEVQYKEQNDAQWTTLASGQIGPYELVDPELGAYQFRARSINALGVRSAWAYSAIIDTANSRIPPQDVQEFSYEVNGSIVNLDWEAVQNFDLSYYKIRHAIETSGATWANATTAAEKISRPATSVTLPSRSGTYLIRAYDKTGIASQNSASVTVTSNELPSYSNTLTQADHSTFSGSKINCEVESSELVISPDLAFEASSADGIDYRSYPVSSSFVADNDLTCRDVMFKPDGTQVYFISAGRPAHMVQFSLQIPFELSSIIPSSEKFVALPLPTNQLHTTLGAYIRDDGLKLYWTASQSGLVRVIEYDIATAWDISTASDTGNFYDLSSDFAIPTGITFKPDGSVMYVCGNNWDGSTGGSFVRQYDMTTNWDITSASLTNSLDLAPQITTDYVTALLINPDGDRLFVLSNDSPDTIFGYSMSTAWDISTASYATGDFVEFDGSVVLTGMAFDNTGGKLFLSDDSFNNKRLLQTTSGQRAVYDFSTYIETHDSTARKVRARVDSAVDRLSRSSGTFDELVGLFDFLDGLFDDLGASDQSGDTNLVYYISTTEDDPAGTPTWSEYKKFRCGEFYGRAFRFRVILTSESPTLTPSIETLTAVVEYN